MSPKTISRNFCALLRGVNVKGTAMKMADVVKVFENAGLKEVKSVLASGNILFYSDQEAAVLKPLLEQAMSEAFQYEAFVFVFSAQEIEEMSRKSPFEAEDGFHCYVFGGEKHAGPLLLEEFRKCRTAGGEEAQVEGGIFYWKIKKGNILNSEFGKILGRRSLKNTFTSRNINTFDKILKQFNS